ncbi:MAG TPA: hypothetical protein VMC42_07380 [Methanoregulaceae archaeon]|nr:hypothetical protein [Methanoregulaceae archaeon]
MKLKNILSGFVLLLIVIAIGGVIADRVITSDPEIQGLTTATAVDIQGIATENDALAWLNSNRGALSNTSLLLPTHLVEDTTGTYIFDVPGLYPVFDAMYGGDLPGEARYTVGYTEDTSAVNGALDYAKSSAISTANKLPDQNNVQTSKTATFVGLDAGRMTSSENALIDGAGQLDFTNSSVLCPFASEVSPYLPPFCNIATMGSSVDVSLVSLVTKTGERSVAASADTPAELGYSVAVTGINSSPAIGSTQASMNVHIQEGRAGIVGTGSRTDTDVTYEVGLLQIKKGEDLTYSESSTASGEIGQFIKSMDYKSGVLI